ncbi:MAG: hypothetical protein Q7K54_02790 [Candidatus Parcubacteria bacterium]|nr:hypothetical protein [Candidatus Parcubacteria bacterium]
MKNAVFLSDTHVGSDFALMPLEVELFDGGQKITASPIQQELFKSYEKLTDEWKNPDILVLNGDIIDGKSKKDFGANVWSTSYNDQINAAIELIDMFKAKKIYVIRGTEYHVSVEGEPAEEILGERLHAVKHRNNYSVYKRYLKIEDVVFQVAHAIGSTKVFMYRATSITREIAMALLNASHEYKADVIVRGHAHYAWESGSPGHMGFILPGWQLQTPFMVRMSPAGAIPDIGALRFEVDGYNFNWEWKTYKLDAERPDLEVC